MNPFASLTFLWASLVSSESNWLKYSFCDLKSPSPRAVVAFSYAFPNPTCPKVATSSNPVAASGMPTTAPRVKPTNGSAKTRRPTLDGISFDVTPKPKLFGFSCCAQKLRNTVPSSIGSSACGTGVGGCGSTLSAERGTGIFSGSFLPNRPKLFLPSILSQKPRRTVPSSIGRLF